jgi:hypothetical protein
MTSQLVRRRELRGEAVEDDLKADPGGQLDWKAAAG